ncbi:MAG: G5 domain-containing protein [Oscillospiraceae bacterium]|nr:G5 domain-containing protein [Oscillospiraceae bacterium]
MQERKDHVTKRKSVFVRMAVVVIPLVLLLLLSQTALAENTYVITDGDRVKVHTTSTTDPVAVLTEAGLALGEDDTYKAQKQGGVSQITVQRQQTVSVQQGEQTIQVASNSETVAALLERLDIPVNEHTTVSAPLDALTYSGMQLRITQNVSQDEVYTLAMPHDTIYCNDSSIPAGTTQVITPGVDGQLRCKATVQYVNGVETSRTVLEETVVQQPVTEVVAIGVGTKEVAPDYVPEKPYIGDGFIVTTTGEVLTYTKKLDTMGTAYSRDGKVRYTYSGTIVKVGSVAVDPSVIPLGTRMYIVSTDGEYIYGIATAEDIGAGVDGARVDLYMDTTDECWVFGYRACDVYILGETDIVREDI